MDFVADFCTMDSESVVFNAEVGDHNLQDVSLATEDDGVISFVDLAWQFFILVNFISSICRLVRTLTRG